MKRSAAQHLLAGVLFLASAAFGGAGWSGLRAAEPSAVVPPVAAPGKAPPLVKSAQSGPWSSTATWEGGKVPAAGDRVQIREGNVVRYDVESDAVIRSIHVAGTLTFARDRNTRLDVGLIKIQAGDDASEVGFDCEGHMEAPDPSKPRAALEVGAPNDPIPAGVTARIRLAYVEGLDKEDCPAIICCGGRMDFHGAPLERTWLKLVHSARVGESKVVAPRPLDGWKVGDRIILTGTTRQIGYIGTRRTNKDGTHSNSVRENPATEERIITEISPNARLTGPTNSLLTLDKPLAVEHSAHGEFRAEVANLSRNVVVESADPDGVRGHTMYHKYSAGSISYAEFRHLGKEGVLGKYSIHFHLCGDTMRGTSVVGASVWGSRNRWITVHGTNFLVVRDVVGYHSLGHGFFLEDGTEVFNLFDRCLAVMACQTKPLPKQVLPYDGNLGSGFWWANSRNAFTRNVAAENDADGYRFEVVKRDDFDPELPLLQPDGRQKKVDVRTLSFLRFEGNEAHCHRLFGVNLGGFSPGNFGKGAGDVEGVGPDAEHCFVLRDTRIWDAHWAFHCGSPYVRIEKMQVHDCTYGLWRCVLTGHTHFEIAFTETFHTLFQPRSTPWENSTEAYPSAVPVDDHPPVTVATHLDRLDGDVYRVRGVATDDFEVKRVLVNGKPARALRGNFAEWEAEVSARDGVVSIHAHAEDVAGNVEKLPHHWEAKIARGGSAE